MEKSSQDERKLLTLKGNLWNLDEFSEIERNPLGMRRIFLNREESPEYEKNPLKLRRLKIKWKTSKLRGILWELKESS